jgi:hypothetical protein
MFLDEFVIPAALATKIVCHCYLRSLSELRAR